MSNDNSFLVLDDGAKSGIKEEIKFDWLEGKATQRTTFTPATGINQILDQNIQFQNTSDGYSPSRELQHVASIPLAVLYIWIDRYGVDPTAKGNERLLSRLLNDPEWAYLRTGRGRLDFKE